MIKHSGLGQLADTLSDPVAGHYPVRRRGERRELRPNWTGIAWLEAQTLKYTELLGGQPVYDGESDGPIWHVRSAARLADQISEGAPTHYARPMIELIDDYSASEHRTSGAQHSTSPCPGCDDWSRTTRCSEHAERGAFSVTDAGFRAARRADAARYRIAAAQSEPVAHLATDADGVLIAQQGDSYDAARNAILDGA